jgi:hypothetical protein
MGHLSAILLLFSLCAFATEDRLIHVDSMSGKGGAWSEYTDNDELNFRRLFDLLEKSPSGEKIMKEASQKAARLGLTLTDVVKVGEGSLTDTTLVRKFNPRSPDVVIYETKSVVYLNRNLGWEDALLDLAHELTHYTRRNSFNPYEDSFNARDFIRSTIEGEGGEVEAFLTECQVARELFSRQSQLRSNCRKIETADGKLSYARAVELFYHVGSYFEGFSKKLADRKLENAFSGLSDQKINFISSAYGVPYPIAALMEYELVLNKVCENDKRRLAYMQQEQEKGPGRSPASTPAAAEKFALSYSSRCKQ